MNDAVPLEDWTDRLQRVLADADGHLRRATG